jgi:NAD(P)-dependent dehydrogenase (short-subunit alcohol dehydrogenase family)
VTVGQRLAGRRILVTGAASGIGLETARLFQGEGAKVALMDRNEALLEKAWAALGRVPFSVVVDVADEQRVAKAVDAAANAMGGIDGIVNAAGISLRKPFSETSVDEWRSVMSVNLDGPFHVCSCALRHMRLANGGTIVNISSGAGLRPLIDFSAYCASKGGLVMFSKALAMDLAADNIRVNVICPGIVMTPMVERRLAISPDREAAVAAFLDKRLMNRFGTAAEIASAALFLSCDESSFVTGSALGVDGGAVFH